MTTPAYDCQDSHIRQSSRHIPRIWVLLTRTVEYFRRHGLVGTLRRIASFIGKGIDTRPYAKRILMAKEDVLDLRTGELVEVKTEEEVRQTLDDSGRTCGLGFMEGMSQHYGKAYRVYKPVRTVILEGTGEVRRIRNTVLLEGVICDGERLGCDRSCFYFWKESWLRRVAPGERPQRTPGATDCL
jgi:hypothetical protein